MAGIIIVGDGPGGLSAALLLAKNGHDTVVYAQDETAMHHAYLYNYLGITEIDGSEFQRVARRQVTDHGARLRDSEVSAVERTDAGFTVRADEGTHEEADYVILAGGKAAQRLAEAAGAEIGDAAVVVGPEFATTVDGLYAVGRMVRPNRSQAVISAGAGATAALDIMAREAGRDVTDWDTPPE